MHLVMVRFGKVIWLFGGRELVGWVIVGHDCRSSMAIMQLGSGW